MSYDAWKKWESQHNSADQKKRIERAYHADNTPVSISIEYGSGCFQGSNGRYNTDLEKCTCVDFVRRKLPCKHMYRLAIDLGCFGDKTKAKNDQYARKIPKSERNDLIISVVGTIENYSDAEQLEIKALLLDVLYHQKKSKIFRDSSIVGNALKDGLLVGAPCYPHFIRKMRKAEMLEAIEKQGDALPEKCNLVRDIAAWLISNQEKYGPILFPNCKEVALGQELSRCSLSVYKYLHRKFDESARMEEQLDIETGEIHTAHKDLPDDFETGLLNLFGTNPS